MDVVLMADEIAVLMEQDPAVANDGGWQSLIGRLQNNLNRTTGELTLSTKDLEWIPRYAFKYGNGGWESTLKKIFKRTLGF